MSMQGSAMMYVTRPTLPKRSAGGASSSTSSRARSTSADFTTTWSNPAACAARRPAVSVWFV